MYIRLSVMWTILLGGWLTLAGCGAQAQPTPSASTLLPTSRVLITDTDSAVENFSQTVSQPPAIEAETLQPVLLTVDDLPQGWVEKPAEIQPAQEETFHFLCAVLPRRSSGYLLMEFVRGAALPVLTEQVTIFPVGQAAQTFAEMQSASRMCSAWQTTDATGAQYDWQAEVTTDTAGREESLAIKIRVESEGFGEATRYAIYWLEGDVIATIQYVNLGEESEGWELVQTLAGQLTVRLKDALP